ncbi:hypothetical protein M9Y10_034194 [Tritrichomonas musculus]|uniref:Survival motor neuron Tudor domain-containing protein n=1 Tax=Tritrichomonas musculus TaxID=1915356 RepID=A0ABR2KEB0_9EUKA
MDPLDKKNIYKISNTQNALVDAFEAAASSFAVNHKIQGAKFYQPKKEEDTPPKPNIKKEHDSFMQFDESSSSDQEQTSVQPKDIQTIDFQELIKKQVKNKEPKQQQQPQQPPHPQQQLQPQPQKKQEQNLMENTKLPVPSHVLVYPPPILDETDPDQTRLLHSWYWAGYYTGLADGKKIANSQ